MEKTGVNKTARKKTAVNKTAMKKAAVNKTSVNKKKFSKVLVRNAVIPVGTHQARKPGKHVRFTKEEKNREEKEEAGESSTSINEPKNLSLPECSTVLKLVDEINNIKLDYKLVNSQKSCKNMTPNVNFKSDQKLFNDLVNVDKPNNVLKPSGKATFNLKGSYKKDPEPDLKELLKYSLQPEYKFTMLVVPEVEKPKPQFDGRSIYRLTRRWDFRDTEFMS